MTKSVLSCLLALFLLFLMTPACLAEVILNTDFFDPVTDLLEQDAGYTGFDLDYRPGDVLYLEGRWATENQWTMEGALLIAGETLSYAQAGAVWPVGLGHVEAGAVYMGDQLFLRTGLSGMLPLFDDRNGPAVIWDTLFSSSDATSSIELGWAWCFGERSFALAGVYSAYTYVFGAYPEGSSAGLAFFRLYVDERVGPLNIQGGAKAYFSFESGAAGAGADLSCAYMFADRIGAGLNLRIICDDEEVTTTYGLNIAVRM